MSVKVANSRFILSSFKGLYRCLTHHLSSFQALGERLIHEAEAAQAFRKTERLEELGSILSNFPIKEYRLIGQYYIGWSISRKGHDAQKLFEKVIEESTTYRARALIDLASRQARKGGFSSNIDYYTEAIKYSQNLYTVVQAERTIAAIKGDEGYHNKALKDLERIAPLVRYSPPIERYQYLNSLAVEFAEVGRIEEAQNVCKIVLASPYAFAYPEWRETADEIALRGYKSRSLVPITRTTPGNIFYLPEPSPATNTPTKSGQGRLLDYVDWKEKMVKEPNGDDKKEKVENSEDINLDDMDEKDLMVKLLYLATQEGKNEKRLRKVVAYAIKVFSEPED